MTKAGLSRTEILEQLSKHDLEVKFTKKNGELRVMKCTLDPTIVGQDTEQKDDDNIVTVWDLEKHAYRAFAIDTIQNVRIL